MAKDTSLLQKQALKETVAYLILAGADKELENNEEQTPLHLALEHGNVEIAVDMVNFGASKEHMQTHQACKPDSECYKTLAKVGNGHVQSKGPMTHERDGLW